MELKLDRNLPVPLGVQLRGQIEYGIATGAVARASRLPSVRELAAELNVAPATVSSVYKELQERGLIETLAGKGTFVADTPRGEHPADALRTLHRALEELLDQAKRLGVGRSELLELVTARLGGPESETRPLHLAFVGIFEAATRAYAATIRRHLRSADRIEALIFDDLRRNAGARERVVAADAVITLRHREHELRELLGEGVELRSVSFIPAGTTRTRLAALDPLDRLAVVATFPEFLITMRDGVRRYAAHVHQLRAVALDDPTLDAVLGWCSAVVYATGADRVLERLPPRTQAIEYRHVPEPLSVEAVLQPLFERRRSPLVKETP